MPTSMAGIVALVVAAGFTAGVIGILLAVAQAKVKLFMELTAKAMAQKIIDKRTAKAASADALMASTAVAAIANRVADDVDGDLARQNFADAAADAAMTPEEAQQMWWETESARSFNADKSGGTDWHDFYIKDSQKNGLSYEEAIEWVDRQEAMIDSAMGYLRLGMTADEAITLARHENVA